MIISTMVSIYVLALASYRFSGVLHFRDNIEYHPILNAHAYVALTVLSSKITTYACTVHCNKKLLFRNCRNFVL